MSPLHDTSNCGKLSSVASATPDTSTDDQGAAAHTPTGYRRGRDVVYADTCLWLPSATLRRLRVEAQASGKNVSWLIEERLIDHGLAPVATDTSAPKRRNRPRDGTVPESATVRISATVLARARNAAGRRSLSWFVADVLAAHDDPPLDGDSGKEDSTMRSP